MIKNKLRVFSAEEKSSIVLELLQEEHPLSVLASSLKTDLERLFKIQITLLL